MSDLYLDPARYVAALKRQRARIAAGLPLSGFDSTDMGAKDTQCSWGLCTKDLEAWPGEEDHLFPKQLPDRSSPKYRTEEQTCPLQTGGEPLGCFYRCRYFQEGLREGDRAAALELYDQRIRDAEND